jgi:hypothetical protein
MTQEQEQAAKNKREMRAMWIFSAGVVLLILGMMGANIDVGQSHLHGRAGHGYQQPVAYGPGEIDHPKDSGSDRAGNLR